MTPTTGKTTITSGYGWRKLRGIPNRHAGMDLVCENRELRSIWNSAHCDVLIGWNSGRGNLIRLYHSPKLRVIYQHMAEIYVQNGSRVSQGQTIGRMGWSGDCVPQGPLGMHLHIEVQELKNGVWQDVDPSGYIGFPNVSGGVFDSSGELDKPLEEKPEKTQPDNFIQTGDKVNFIGKKQYASSAGDSPADARAGKATVTKICRNAKYPYHIIASPDDKSNVYGWVESDCVVKHANNQPTQENKTGYQVGDRLVFSSGYFHSSDGPDRALHVAKKQLAFDRGIVGEILAAANNPIKMLSPIDYKTPICWCNSGDIRGKW